MGKRVRLELVAGASSKFWELTVTGTTLTTAWGRIGAAGQTATKAFASSERAALAGEKLLAEKTGKGYRPTSARAPRPGAVATSIGASADELGKLAAAIAGVAKKPSSRRFALEWQACKIETCDGNLVVGEPLGSETLVANQSGAPVEVFHLIDLAAAKGGTIVGLRLGGEPAVTWQLHAPITIKSGRYGVRSEGYGYAARKRDARTAGTKTRDEHTMHLVRAGKVRSIATVVGLDGEGRPTCYLLGDALRPEVFAAKAGPRDPFAQRDVRATRDELRALGVAMAARSRKPVSPRFRLEPMPGKVRPVGGKLVYGDPNGEHARLAVPGSEPVTVFRVVDLLSYSDGYGAWIYGARLGGGPAVRWKQLRTIALTSDCFGFWSPGFPTEDITFESVYKHGDLTAAIGCVHTTAAVDRTCCPVVLGTDADGQPAVLLLGNGLDVGVYVHRKPRA